MNYIEYKVEGNFKAWTPEFRPIWRFKASFFRRDGVVRLLPNIAVQVSKKGSFALAVSWITCFAQVLRISKKEQNESVKG
jgi:hypothetical protein